MELTGGEGQMLTIEATLAALVLVTSTIFLAQFVSPAAVERGGDYSKTQLTDLGQDALTGLTSPSVIPPPGFRVELYREWNSTEDDGEKWSWDENGSPTGAIMPPARDFNDTPIYEGTGGDWTGEPLSINTSEGENTTVWFAARRRGSPLGNLSIGRLNKLNSLDYLSGGSKVEKYPDRNSVDFSFNGGVYGKNYSSRLVWFNTSEETSGLMFVWLNASPERHDDVVRIDPGESEYRNYDPDWHGASLTQGSTVRIEVHRPGDPPCDHCGSPPFWASFFWPPPERIHVDGEDFHIHNVPEGGSRTKKGVTVEHLSSPGSVERYDLTFREPALGGYSVYWGHMYGFPNPGFGRTPLNPWLSDPVYLLVGKSTALGDQLSPLQNSVDPSRGEPGYFGEDVVPILESSLPRNVDFKFAVYRMKGGRPGVAVSDEGERLEYRRGRPPASEPVSLGRQFVASGGGAFHVYEARLTLWYR